MRVGRFIGMVIAVAAVVVSAAPVWAVDYFVDGVDGHDTNDGLSRATAWKTIGKANAVVAPGDTVHVLEGIYNQSLSPAQGGTSNDARVTYVAEGRVVLRAAGINFRSWTTFDGFEVRERVTNGIHQAVNGTISGLVVRNCRFLRNGGAGLNADFLSGARIERSVFAFNTGAGIVGNSIDGSVFDHCTVHGNGGRGLDLRGAGNRVTNSVITSNGGAGIANADASNASDFNDIFGNSQGPYAGGIVAGPNDISVDPQHVSPGADLYHLRPTSLLIGQASDGFSIGALGVGFLSSKAADDWAGWTDGNGVAVGDPSAQVVFDTFGRLMIRDDLTVAVITSPVIDVGIKGPGFITLDFEGVEVTDLPAGQRQIVDFDPSTREREFRIRTASTAEGIASKPFVVETRRERCHIPGRFMQAELTLRRDG